MFVIPSHHYIGIVSRYSYVCMWRQSSSLPNDSYKNWYPNAWSEWPHQGLSNLTTAQGKTLEADGNGELVRHRWRQSNRNLKYLFLVYNRAKKLTKRMQIWVCTRRKLIEWYASMAIDQLCFREMITRAALSDKPTELYCYELYIDGWYRIDLEFRFLSIYVLILKINCEFIPSPRKMWLKGLRPVLEGFVVSMHQDACETGGQIPRALSEGFDVLFAQARVHWDNKPRQIGLNHDYNMTFSISPREY